jgi:hypothetical protein
MKKEVIVLTALVLSALALHGQTHEDMPSPFDKKFHAGISLNSYWTTVRGSSLPREYFTKPSIGFNFRAEYYFTKAIGIGLGLGYQQYGMGIINPDNDKSLGDPDSTYLERVRFHSIEIPISLLLRTPKDVIKGIRLSGSFSVVPIKVFKSSNIFQNVDNGFHLQNDVSNQYASSDMLVQFSGGPEIDAGGTGLFQIHFMYSQGTQNVFAQGQGNGTNHSMGLRIAWLFGSKLRVKDASNTHGH